MTLRRIKILALSGLVALVSVFSFGTSSAQAQRFRGGPPARVFVSPRAHFFFGHPFWGGYPYWYPYGYYDSVEYRTEQGFQDGFNSGKSDAKKSKPDDPSSHKHYRNSDSNAYRNSFLKGYNEGYSDYARR